MKLHYWNKVPNLGDMLNTVLFPDAEWALHDEADTFGIGSLLELATGRDVSIFGTGRAGLRAPFTDLSRARVYALRGLLTRDLIVDRRLYCVYGDPGLLMPDYFPPAPYHGRTVYVPHWADTSPRSEGPVVDILGDIEEACALISGAETVVASAFHGVVLADAYGVERVQIETEANQPFKFTDHGTLVGWPGYRTRHIAPPRIIGELQDGLRYALEALRRAADGLGTEKRGNPQAEMSEA